MSRTLVAGALLLASLAPTGCGDGPVDRVARRADRLCACSDRACVDAANEAMLREVKAVAARATKAEAERIMDVLARAGGCARDVINGTDGTEGDR